MFRGKPFHERGILFALIVSAFRQLVVKFVHTCLQLCHVSESLSCLLSHGGIVLKNHHLWQIAYGSVVRYSHHSLCGFLHSTENLKQCRLSSTVFSHECYSVSVVDDEACTAEQRFYSKLNFKLFY